MTHVSSYYIARVLTLSEKSFIKISKEKLFSSLERAKAFVDQQRWVIREEDENADRVRFEIKELYLDSQDKGMIWEYDMFGEALAHSTSSAFNFEVGDIVEILKFSELKIWSLKVAALGVISQINQDVYTIDYISELGYFNQAELDVSDLCVYDKDVPQKLQFLETWSKHILGEKLMDEKVVRDILSRKIHLFNEEVPF